MASCKSGGLQRVVLPFWNIAEASESRVYICTDAASSSTHSLRRSHSRMRLSCDMSITESSLSGTFCLGVINDLDGILNFSTTSKSSLLLQPAIDMIVRTPVGRLSPLLSEPFSVMVLNIFSQMIFPSWLN